MAILPGLDENIFKGSVLYTQSSVDLNLSRSLAIYSEIFFRHPTSIEVP